MLQRKLQKDNLKKVAIVMLTVGAVSLNVFGLLEFGYFGKIRFYVRAEVFFKK